MIVVMPLLTSCPALGEAVDFDEHPEYLFELFYGNVMGAKRFFCHAPGAFGKGLFLPD